MPKLLTDRMERIDLERKLCRSSFYTFLQKFWPVIIPEKPVWNWHIKYLCDELQTVSERVFKGLPKEYDLVLNVPPGTSKPVWEGTPVLMANGIYKKLKEVEKGDRVIGKSGKPCDVTAVHVQGELPCVRIVTNGGRFLIAAEDHPVLTADGWKLAGDIRPHDMVALMHRPRIESEQESGRTDDDFRLAGYLIGDGSLAHNCCSLTSKDPEYIDDFVACVGRMGFSHIIRKDKTGLTRINLSKGKNQPRQWVRDVGLFNSTSRTKFVPDFVWKGSNEQVAAFLAAYFHCDGCVSYRHTGKRNLVVSMCSISKKLAVGVQRLLLRLGIPMRLRVRVARSGFSYNRGLKNYKYYVVETTDQDAAVRFLEKVPLIGRKKDKLEGFYPRRKTFDQSYWPDEVVSVEHIGKRSCRCLTVDRDASFVANDIVVHNSTITSIMFPVWCLVRMQSTRSIVATHTQTLGLELSRRSRMILKSEQFRQLFNIELEDDQDAKGFWVTKGGGSRFSCTVSGANPIGFHSHFLIVDDPIDPEKVLSKVSLQTAKQFMEETLPSRKIDNLVSVTILIMQRLAQDDPSANMLKEPNVKHICLPAEDGDNVSPPEVRKYYQNGLLDPVRLPQEVLNVKKKRPYYYSGQYLERPIPKGGGTFQVNRAFLIAPDGTPIPHSNHPPLITVVRFWDTALSAGKGAYTVGWKMGDDGQNFWILHVAREQKEPGERNRWIRQIAERDGKDVEQCIEQPSGFGKESAEATARVLAGFRVRLEPVKSNKETRWDTFADQWNVGGVHMMQGEWNQDVIDEYEHCPFSTYKDQLDAGSDCFARLIAIREEKERKRKEEEYLKGILLTNNVPEAYKRKMENLKQNREIEADNSVSKIDMGNGEVVEIPWDE